MLPEHYDIIERTKYEELWQRGDYRSQSAVPFVSEMDNEVNFTGEVLEVGCGDGVTAFELLKLGYNVTATDITLEGLKYNLRAITAPIWRLPFKDNSFDTIYSTDVLEHLPPEMVNDAIKEMQRVCKTDGWQFHKIATFAMGTEHLTVEDISWWGAQFDIEKIKNYKLYKR